MGAFMSRLLRSRALASKSAAVHDATLELQRGSGENCFYEFEFVIDAAPHFVVSQQDDTTAR